MKNFARMAALAAAATIIATPAAAQVAPFNGPATGTVRITKPLTLESQDDLDFGSVIVWDNGTITIEQDGDITCPATLVCDLVGTPARYTVRGTNNHTVQVNASSSTLSNGTDNLTFNPDAPATVPLSNSGQVGVDFYVGGNIAIPATASAGTYVGDLDVTVEY